LADAINGIRIREKLTCSPHSPYARQAPPTRLLRGRVESNLCSYELLDIIIHHNIEWSLAPSKHLNDEIIDTEMLKQKEHHHNHAKLPTTDDRIRRLCANLHGRGFVKAPYLDEQPKYHISNPKQQQKPPHPKNPQTVA
jgi:hypothetical protein